MSRELLNKKLEFSIKEASTLKHYEEVDDAYLFGKVSPTKTGIIISFLISLFAGLVIVIVRGIYFIPVTNPAEFEDNGIMTPIFGVIPQVEEDNDTEENERFSQSLESLIVNVKINLEIMKMINQEKLSCLQALLHRMENHLLRETLQKNCQKLTKRFCFLTVILRGAIKMITLISQK